MTEYEPALDRPKIEKLDPHPNTCFEVLGPLFSLKKGQSISKVVEIAGLPVQSTGAFDIQEQGFWILDGADREAFSGKQSPFIALLLRCSSFSDFKKIAKPDYEINIFGTRAAGIQLRDNMWDILVIEAH
jgi:hypothetical protein